MKVSESSDIDREGVSFSSLRFTKLGYIFREQSIVDIGVDAHIEIKRGNIGTGKLVGLQIKSGSSYFSQETGDSFTYRGDQKHLDYWLDHSLPIIIILYHPKLEELYWEVVSKEKITSTGSGWKLQIPKHQKVNVGMAVDINRLVSKVSAFKDYTIASISDMSHNAAKRYSIRVVLNKEYTQLEMLNLSKNLVADIKQQVYYRSILTSERWKEENAHVVWLLIYPSNEDEKNNNQIAHIQWISDKLSRDFSPEKLQGENIGNGIIIDWNDSYQTTAQFFDENTMKKADFVQKIDAIVDSVTSQIEKAKVIIDQLEAKQVTESSFSTQMFKIQKIVNDNYHLGISLGVPPFECSDLGKQFQCLIAMADNIVLPFSGIGASSDWRFDFFYYKRNFRGYQDDIEKFSFERKKI